MISTATRIAKARRDDEQGFSLVELLVVIVILGVLAGIVVFAVGGINDRGQASACATDRKTIEAAQEAYFAKNASYATEPQLAAGGFIRGESANMSTTPDNTATPKTFTVTGVGACA